jgi:hypothetical protein
MPFKNFKLMNIFNLVVGIALISISIFPFDSLLFIVSLVNIFIGLGGFEWVEKIIEK